MHVWFALISPDSPRRDLPLAWLAVMIALLTLPACKREERSFTVSPPNARPPGGIRLSDLHPGQIQPTPHDINGYEENAVALTEGKRLFSAFNCSGCHGNGGGNIGPALIDRKWIYGSAPEQVFATIAEGRPNGMPAFGDKLNAQQIWQLSAYVRSMSGMVSQNTATGRSDHMKSNPPENSIDPAPATSPQIPTTTQKRE